MKKVFKVLAISTMCLGMPLLNACSFFRSGESEAIGIKEVLVDYDDSGNALITISYTDKKMQPVTFTLPKGTDGETGNGIKKIEYNQDDYGNTEITITYTSDSMKPVTINLAPGKSIVDVKFDTDEEDNTLIVFIDSEGNELSPITVFKGDTGEKGVGIVLIDPEYDDATGETTLTFYYDNDEEHQNPIKVVIPPAKGIDDVESDKRGPYYYLTFYYTDGTFKEVAFKAAPDWLRGNDRPNEDTKANDGDYYFDESHSVIYRKVGDEWHVVARFTAEETTYAVSFELNAADAIWTNPEEQPHYFPTITRGATFYSMNYTFPEVYRNGYKFGGWSTSPIHKVTNGLFTDLTPVMSDMTLYAVWTSM